MTRNKRLIKSALEEYSDDELIENYGALYLNEVGDTWEDMLNNVDDMQYYLERESIDWLLARVCYGGQYNHKGFDGSQTFDPSCEYYVVSAYGNFYSIDEHFITKWLKEKIEEYGVEEFRQWCTENINEFNV